MPYIATSYALRVSRFANGVLDMTHGFERDFTLANRANTFHVRGSKREISPIFSTE